MNKEVEAANLLLGESSGEQFTVIWHGIPFRYKIRPITARMLIRMSREIAMIPTPELDDIHFQAELEHANGLSHICRAIAIASGSKHIWFSSMIIEQLELKHIYTLWKTIMANSDPSSFFFIMVSAKGMNRLKSNKVQSSEQTASSEPSP